MLSAEDNETLTRVGPGTPMGNLLRRYWIPACLSSEIGPPDGSPARVRLLGDMRLHLSYLEHHPQTQMPPELQVKRQSFAH